MINALHIIGQIILGGFFIYNGLKHLKDRNDYAAYANSLKVPAPKFAVIFTGILLLVGGLGILLNNHVNGAIILLTIFLIPTSFTAHAFWKAQNPGERSSQKIAFLKNMAILGALFLLVA